MALGRCAPACSSCRSRADGVPLARAAARRSPDARRGPSSCASSSSARSSARSWSRASAATRSRTWSLARAGAPASQALASVLLDRLLGSSSILVSAVVGARARALRARANRRSPGRLPRPRPAARDRAAVRLQHARRRRSCAAPGPRCRPGRARGIRSASCSTRCRPIARPTTMLAGVLVGSIAVQVLRILQAWLLGRSLGIDAPLDELLRVHPDHPAGHAAADHVSGLGTARGVRLDVRASRRVRRRARSRCRCCSWRSASSATCRAESCTRWASRTASARARARARAEGNRCVEGNDEDSMLSVSCSSPLSLPLPSLPFALCPLPLQVP